MAEKVRILPIWPSTPTGDDLSLFKSAKDDLFLDYLIQPVPALRGSPFRVIALRTRPEFICDYAFVPNPSKQSIFNAMEWALGDKDDPRAMTVLKQMKQIFGAGVREVD